MNTSDHLGFGSFISNIELVSVVTPFQFGQLGDNDKYRQSLETILGICNPLSTPSPKGLYDQYNQLSLPLKIQLSYHLRFLSDLVILYSDQRHYSGYPPNFHTKDSISDFKSLTREIFRLTRPSYTIYYIYSFDEWIDDHIIQKIGLSRLKGRTTPLTRLGHHFKQDSRTNLENGVSKIEFYFFTSDLQADAHGYNLYKIPLSQSIEAIEKLSNIYLRPRQETTETSKNGVYYENLVVDHSLKAAAFVAKMIEGLAPPSVSYNKIKPHFSSTETVSRSLNDTL